MSVTLSLCLQDWSLHRKGPRDQARHQEKVREVIKGNLGDIISNESIITSHGDKIVKVPIRSLEEYSFRFDPFKKDGVGQGPGDSQPGDVIGTLPGQEPGKGRQAGNEPGIDYYEAEFTIDELAEMVFADLGLPNLKDKGQREVPSEKIVFNDVRRTGIIPNLGKSGGTRVSSAYRLCLEIIEGRYNPTLWNIYPFHFSDGDNWGDEDNRTCVELVKRIITHANLFGYGEIKEEPYSRWATSTLMSAFPPITAPEFVGITIKSKEDVYPALKRFFAKDAVSAQPAAVSK